MENLVAIRPHAVMYDVTLQLRQQDVRPALDEYFAKNPVEVRVERKGFRPRDANQNELEERDLTGLYRDYWLAQIYKAVQERTNQRVLHLMELNVRRVGNMYLLNAQIHLFPTVTLQNTVERLADMFLGEDPINADLIDQEIGRRRVLLQFNPSRFTRIEKPDRGAERDDVWECDVTNEVDIAQGLSSQKMIVKLSTTAAVELVDAMLGKTVGDTVIVHQPIAPGSDHKVKHIYKINALLDVKDVSDEELCSSEGVPSMDSLRENLRRELRRNFDDRFNDILADALLRSTSISPIPHNWVHNRILGYLEAMFAEHGKDKFLKSLGVRDVAEAVQGLGQKMAMKLHVELIAHALASALNLAATEDEIQIVAEEFKINQNLSEDTRDALEMEVTERKVFEYYRSGGKVTNGNISRVKAVSSLII